MKMLPPVSTRVAATPRTSGKVPAKKQVANPGVEFDTALASARAKPQAQSQDARRTQGFESTKRRSGDAKEAQPGRADAVAAEVPAALPQAKSTAPERAASDDSEKNETNIQPEGKQDDAATIQEQCAAVSQGVSPSAQAGGAEDAVDEEAQKLARQDAGVGEVPQRPVVALVRRGDGEQKPQKDAEDVQPAADGSEPEQGGEAPTKGARGKRGGKENAGEGQVQLPPERKEAVVKPAARSEDTEAEMQDVEKEAPRVFEAPVKKPRTVEAAKEWGGAEAKVEAQQAAAVVPQAAKDVEPAAAKLPETEGAEREAKPQAMPAVVAGGFEGGGKEVREAKVAPAAQETPQSAGQETYEQVVLGLKSKLDARNGKAEISLNPPNLGRVNVSVSLDNGMLTAQFHSESDVVRNLLKENMDKLKSVLQGQGVAVDRLAVNAPESQAGGSATGQQSSFGSAANDGRSAGQYQQNGRQGSPQSQGDGFARMFRQAQEVPIDMVA